jgi:hypothetical protein
MMDAMKRLSILILLIGNFACFGAQDPRIAEIRKECKNIDRHVKDLSHRTYSFDWLDAGTGVEVFKDKYGAIRLIKVESIGECSRSNYRYYFKDKLLIFVSSYLQSWCYMSNVIPPPEIPITREKDYVYFSNNKLISWKGDQKNDTTCYWRPRSDTAKQREILADVDTLLDSTFSR